MFWCLVFRLLNLNFDFGSSSQSKSESLTYYPIVISSSPTLRYQAYGLTFACEFPLPELSTAPEDSSPADVRIEIGEPVAPESVSQALRPDADIELSLKFETARCTLFFTSVGRFTVSEGCHILVEPIEGLGPSTWRLPLLGAVMALLLEQRGFFVLHAGALDMGGFAVSFLGQKKQGKSTLNAALSVAGYPLFSDDTVALSWPDSVGAEKTALPLTLPGFAQIKLVPDAVRAVLQGDVADWPAVAPELTQIDKRAFSAPLATHALPLRHLFVLSSLPKSDGAANTATPEDDIRLRLLAPQEAFGYLMPHTYGARFGDLYLKGERKKTHFAACARLVRECQVWELARRRDLNLLPATIEAIGRAVGATSNR